jgi:hypothetical protein
MTIPHVGIIGRYVRAGLVAMVLWSGPCLIYAGPPNTPVLDGRPTEYDGSDLRGSFSGLPNWPGNSITNLYVTWDAGFLYVAVQGRVEGNKFAVLLDVDPDAETGATTTTNWIESDIPAIRWNSMGWLAAETPGNDAFGLDYMFVTEGNFKDMLRIRYDGASFDAESVEILYVGEGLALPGAPVEMAVRSDDVSCDLIGFEARISWDVLYEGVRFGTVMAGEKVPRGARLRVFAHLFNNNPDLAFSSPDTIPAQTDPAASYENGLLTTASYVDIEIDGDGDGLPDLAPGDVNAPYLVAAMGRAGQSMAYVRFNEAVSSPAASNTANWRVNGLAPVSVAMIAPDSVLLNLSASLPSAENVVEVRALDIPDSSGNAKVARFCFTPSAVGLSSPVMVEFLLYTDSGLGHSPGAGSFHLNGSIEPLTWEFPPSTRAPLSPLSNAWYKKTVTFPPGASTNLFYKYSGVLNNTGTNNYEMVRLLDYADASRRLILDSAIPLVTVTDYLGAAGAPWRDTGDDTNGHNLVYMDAQRGDAGVRQRNTALFQLDLSARDLDGISRVMVMGSDPLRGFNRDHSGVADYPGDLVSWSEAGIELYDDGTLGDLVAGDGIYAREWVWAIDGKDNAAVPVLPYSLVGGDIATQPWAGFGWLDRRSYRSFQYRYFVHGPAASSGLGSPSAAFDVYLPANIQHHVLPVHIWDNNALSFAPARYPPEVIDVGHGPGGVKVVFTNVISEGQHGIEIASDLTGGWANYAQMASGGEGWWTAEVAFATSPEFYRPIAGNVGPRQTTWWTPNPIPATGGPLRIWFHQYGRNVAGRRDVHIHTTIQADGSRDPVAWSGHPMTFAGNGLWYIDFNLVGGTNDIARFVFRDGPAQNWDTDWGYADADQYRLHIGGRASWTPERVAPGGVLHITYRAAGGPLEGQAVLLQAGFDKFEGTDWWGTVEAAMTPLGGNVWEYQLSVPAGAVKSAHFLFKNSEQTIWDDYNHPMHWQAFIQD